MICFSRISCNSTYRLRYWNEMQKSIHRLVCGWPVATVLTACGIETVGITGGTVINGLLGCNSTYRLRYWNVWRIHEQHRTYLQLQQYLPLAVLKPDNICAQPLLLVATVLTACGIETSKSNNKEKLLNVATVLTACGIETLLRIPMNRWILLQQYLPLAVLKRFVK